MTLQMGVLCLALLGLSAALVCPDGGMCEDKNTCCKNVVGGYGCCPLPHAECCSDHLHCCYEGTVCDLVHGKCTNKTVSLPWMSRLPAKRAALVPQLVEGVKAVICPDQESECPDDTTCCQLLDGSWGCCPLKKAVCCEDKSHCCPEGTTCDIPHSRCVTASLEYVPMLEKLPARKREKLPGAAVGSVTCPDGKSSCPDSFTCCLMEGGDYGCCPYPQAMCCSDHIHCCPPNTVCDLEHGVCKSGETRLPMLKKIAALPDHVGSVPCNDSVACADGSTCCKSPAGQWACCPLPKAVCCEDHLHCCPHGTVCNLAASTCDDPAGGAVMPWLSKEPAFPLLTDNSKCDKSTSCPGKSTCCKTASGDWACCPLPQAVCCDDHVHCCPHGTVCNLEEESCDDPAGLLPSARWAAKTPAVTSDLQDEKCDKQTMCPGGTTCCKKDSGVWACCPLPQAVCCSDHEHCCPKGYKCNVAEQTCDKPDGARLPWLQKIPALGAESASAPPRPAKNMCDAQTSCPRDTTCCFMEKTHKWGCCPLPKAVCCSDGNHCCPSGHTCEPHRSSCSKGARVVPWFTKLSARTEPAAATAVIDVKCDDKSSCASGTTCCKLQTGEWGCCPLVKAVCCADHEHCCPQGYTCNMQTGTCEKKSDERLVDSLPQVEVEPADVDVDVDVPCDSRGEFVCPQRDTCCQISASEWACCPSPRAVCCSDKKHCCPAGHTCDLQTGGCAPQARLTWDSLIPDGRKNSVGRGL